MGPSLSLLSVLLITAVPQASGASLSCVNDGCYCACQGQPVIYECTITDSNVVATVWEGTIFDCPPDNEIRLAHALYTRGVSGLCNSGSINASSLLSDGNTLTSILNITSVSNSFDKGSIRCVESYGSREGNSSEMTLPVISSSSSHFQADQTELNVYISEGQLLFSWNSLAPGCPYLNYKIQSSNCGSCLNGSVVNTTSVICTNLTTDGRNCSLTVTPFAIACGDTSGRSSNLRKVTLKVPEVKDIEVIPHYSSEGNLTALTTIFSQSTQPTLSDGIDDDAVKYTVTYSDALSTFTCFALQVNASDCSKAHCSVLVPASNLSICTASGSVSVVIYASNKLGQGPLSMPFVRESINTFVNVSYDPTSRSIVCVFLKGHPAEIYVCNVTLAMASSKICDGIISGSLYSSRSENGTVYVSLGNIQNNKKFCYAVLAIDGISSAIVHGDFLHRDSNARTQTIIGVSISTTLLLLLVLTLLICLLVICIKKDFRKKCYGCCYRVKSKEPETNFQIEIEQPYKRPRGAVAPEDVIERRPVANVGSKDAQRLKAATYRTEPATFKASVKCKEEAKKESNDDWLTTGTAWIKSFF